MCAISRYSSSTDKKKKIPLLIAYSEQERVEGMFVLAKTLHLGTLKTLMEDTSGLPELSSNMWILVGSMASHGFNVLCHCYSVSGNSWSDLPNRVRAMGYHFHSFTASSFNLMCTPC